MTHGGNRPCRLIHAHRHGTLPPESSYTVALATVAAEPGERVVRIRWLTPEREWQVCYAPDTKEATQ